MTNATLEIEQLAGKFVAVTSGNGTTSWLPLQDNMQDLANAAIDAYWGKSVVSDHVINGYGVRVCGTGAYWTVYGAESFARAEVSRLSTILGA
jgi:hypothetical protein